MHKPKNITTTHQIAFIYLYFASETDKQLATEEMMMISNKVENWINKDVNNSLKLNAWDILSESLNWLSSLTPSQKETEFILIFDSFKEQCSSSQKITIIEDLKEISKSDGVVLEAEKKLIEKSSDMLEN